MSKICAICGRPVESGVVVHRDCVPQWHPASEPPILDEIVFVIVNGHFDNIFFEEALETAYYSEADGWALEHYADWDSPDVRCWIETDALPEPPKKFLHGSHLSGNARDNRDSRLSDPDAYPSIDMPEI